MWKIQELFDDFHHKDPRIKNNVRLIHICTTCGYRTPELAPLNLTDKEISAIPLPDFEIRNQDVCDGCNKKAWKAAQANSILSEIRE